MNVCVALVSDLLRVRVISCDLVLEPQACMSGKTAVPRAATGTHYRSVGQLVRCVLEVAGVNIYIYSFRSLE